MIMLFLGRKSHITVSTESRGAALYVQLLDIWHEMMNVLIFLFRSAYEYFHVMGNEINKNCENMVVRNKNNNQKEVFTVMKKT